MSCLVGGGLLFKLVLCVHIKCMHMALIVWFEGFKVGWGGGCIFFVALSRLFTSAALISATNQNYDHNFTKKSIKSLLIFFTLQSDKSVICRFSPCQKSAACVLSRVSPAQYQRVGDRNTYSPLGYWKILRNDVPYSSGFTLTRRFGQEN